MSVTIFKSKANMAIIGENGNNAYMYNYMKSLLLLRFLVFLVGDKIANVRTP